MLFFCGRQWQYIFFVIICHKNAQIRLVIVIVWFIKDFRTSIMKVFQIIHTGIQNSFISANLHLPQQIIFTLCTGIKTDIF